MVKETISNEKSEKNLKNNDKLLLQSKCKEFENLMSSNRKLLHTVHSQNYQMRKQQIEYKFMKQKYKHVLIFLFLFYKKMLIIFFLE